MLQIGEDDVVRVSYSLCVGAKGVSTSRSPLVYRQTKYHCKSHCVDERSVDYTILGVKHGTNQIGWIFYWTKQRVDKQNTRMHWLNACKLCVECYNLWKLFFGKPELEYQSESRGPRWENNIKMKLKWIVSKCVDWIYETQDKENLQAFVYTVMILRFHKMGISWLVLRMWICRARLFSDGPFSSPLWSCDVCHE